MNGIYLSLLKYALSQLLGAAKGAAAYTLLTTVVLPLVATLGAAGELPTSIQADVAALEAAVAAAPNA